MISGDELNILKAGHFADRLYYLRFTKMTRLYHNEQMHFTLCKLSFYLTRLTIFMKGCDFLKLVLKIKSFLMMLCALVLAISILLTCSATMHTDSLNSFYNNIIERECYKNIYIYDCNGTPIYTGGFSDDSVLRLATFHIIGDKNKSIPNALLTTMYPEVYSSNIFNGYSPVKKECHLTIDLKLQTAAYKLLSNGGYRGTIIVSDYTTGEIKAMVSTPSVDVYNTESIEDGAFLNKAICCYPPGSVFKSVTVASVLEKEPSAKDYSFTCSGRMRHISCFNQTAHGEQTLSDALSNSCNCGISAFAQEYITPRYLDSYTEKSNITSDSIISDFKIKAGNINANDDLMWAANGQSQNMVTPIGVVSFYNAIANNGIQHQLKLLKTSPSTEAQIMSPSTSSFIKTSLAEVTGKLDISCCSFGKTGTAELDNANSHSWFICCLNDSKAPTYTVLVFLEHGGMSNLAKELSCRYITNAILNEEAPI